MIYEVSFIRLSSCLPVCCQNRVKFNTKTLSITWRWCTVIEKSSQKNDI